MANAHEVHRGNRSDGNPGIVCVSLNALLLPNGKYHDRFINHLAALGIKEVWLITSRTFSSYLALTKQEGWQERTILRILDYLREKGIVPHVISPYDQVIINGTACQRGEGYEKCKLRSFEEDLLNCPTNISPSSYCEQLIGAKYKNVNNIFSENTTQTTANAIFRTAIKSGPLESFFDTNTNNLDLLIRLIPSSTPPACFLVNTDQTPSPTTPHNQAAIDLETKQNPEHMQPASRAPSPEHVYGIPNGRPKPDPSYENVKRPNPYVNVVLSPDDRHPPGEIDLDRTLLPDTSGANQVDPHQQVASQPPLESFLSPPYHRLGERADVSPPYNQLWGSASLPPDVTTSPHYDTLARRNKALAQGYKGNIYGDPNVTPPPKHRGFRGLNGVSSTRSTEALETFRIGADYRETGDLRKETHEDTQSNPFHSPERAARLMAGLSDHAYTSPFSPPNGQRHHRSDSTLQPPPLPPRSSGNSIWGLNGYLNEAQKSSYVKSCILRNLFTDRKSDDELSKLTKNSPQCQVLKTLVKVNLVKDPNTFAAFYRDCDPNIRRLIRTFTLPDNIKGIYRKIDQEEQTQGAATSTPPARRATISVITSPPETGLDNALASRVPRERAHTHGDLNHNSVC